jgi:hypothetical protein
MPLIQQEGLLSKQDGMSFSNDKRKLSNDLCNFTKNVTQLIPNNQ